MTQIRRARRPALTSNDPASGVAFALSWHLGWALVVVAVGAVLMGTGRLDPGPQWWAPMLWPPTLWALVSGAAPALVGAGLSAMGDRARTAAVVLWIVGAMAAVLLGGGASGPLAAWSLAPLAAASAFREPKRLPLGTAGAVGVAAVAGLSSALIRLPSAPAAAAPWLSLLAVGGIALAFGAGLVAMHVAVRRETRARDTVETGLLEVLENQPQLLLELYPGGTILEAFGQPPPGWRARDLIDRNLVDLINADDRGAAKDALHQVVNGGSSEITLRPAHDADGSWELSLRRMSATRIVGAVRDARAQRAREAELDAALAAAEQQNQGKSRFLANMSHELRTPLNAIMGFSDIMRQRLFGPLSDRYAEYAELVHESGAHLLELINDVLDMSKIEADRFELAREGFDAREAIAAALRLLRGQADRAGVSLRGLLPPEAMAAHADRRALKQIAINLLSNALKFTPRGGAVTLTLQPAGEMLELIVADTGVGIAPGDLERLGRPFEQAGDPGQKAGGSGLGLSLVRAFAQLHGGEMWIESALGEGTTVIVRMPILTPQHAEAPPPLVAEG